MRSIFDHKQYDPLNLEGSYSISIMLEKKINGLDWNIKTKGDSHGRVYHNRDLNLKLLNNEIDSENYSYEYYLTVEDMACIFIYDSGYLITQSWSRVHPLVNDKKKISFEEACGYINRVKEKWERAMWQMSINKMERV